MRLIKPSVEIIKQEKYDLLHVFKFIELAGRTCYKSENKITEDSASEFVDRMIKSGHGAMLEHGTIYLTIPVSDISNPIIYKYILNSYSKIFIDFTNSYITTNYRVLIENNWLDDLKYISEPYLFHAKRTTVKFICDRGVSHEFVRHRVFSFAQESTRYCNYTKDKFNNELTFIIPCWIKDLKEGNYYAYCEYHHSKNDASKRWFDSCMSAEFVYTNLIEEGWKPQEARAVLPNSLKTELIMTGFDSDWQHFFELRCVPSAHPQAKELADMLKDKFNKDLTEGKDKYSI